MSDKGTAAAIAAQLGRQASLDRELATLVPPASVKYSIIADEGPDEDEDEDEDEDYFGDGNDDAAMPPRISVMSVVEEEEKEEVDEANGDPKGGARKSGRRTSANLVEYPEDMQRGAMLRATASLRGSTDIAEELDLDLWDEFGDDEETGNLTRMSRAKTDNPMLVTTTRRASTLL